MGASPNESKFNEHDLKLLLAVAIGIVQRFGLYEFTILRLQDYDLLNKVGCI